LICRVTEDTFGGNIPTGDSAVELLAGDRIVRGRHDRGQHASRIVILRYVPLPTTANNAMKGRLS
jgi:hypothetical protein